MRVSAETLTICLVFLFQGNMNEEVAVAMGYDNLFFPSAFLVVGAGLAVAMVAAELSFNSLKGGLKRRRSKMTLSLEKTRTTTPMTPPIPKRGLAFVRRARNFN